MKLKHVAILLSACAFVGAGIALMDGQYSAAVLVGAVALMVGVLAMFADGGERY